MSFHASLKTMDPPGTTSQGQLLWHLCVKRYSRPSRATTLGNTLAKWRLELGMMHNDAWYCWYGTSSHKENQGDWNVKICDDDDDNDDDDDANRRCKDVSTCVQIEKETPTNEHTACQFRVSGFIINFWDPILCICIAIQHNRFRANLRAKQLTCTVSQPK